MKDDWLSDIVIVNESFDIQVIGDVSIFRSFGDACRKIEPWYGTEVDYFAFSGSGIQLAFSADGNRTIIQEVKPKNIDLEIVANWLRQNVQSLYEVRQYKAKKKKLVLGMNEETGIFPQSLEGMIAYLGFDK